MPLKDRAQESVRRAARRADLKARAEADVPGLRADLMEALSYDPETGVFRWKVPAGPRKAGELAGTKRPDGYLHLHFRQQQYMLHRLAWLFVTGSWPDDLIDHEDRDKANNRAKNLRAAGQVLNQHNRVKLGPKNRSGLLGVHLSNGKYPQACVRVNRRRVYLGTFDTPEAAHAAYMAAKKAVIEHGPQIADQLAAAAVRRR